MLDTGLIPFKEKFPDRFVECGIAEKDMVSQAGGLALEGLVPVVHSFACFLSTRPNEQIYNNATERTKVLYVGSLAGVIPAAPGHCHQSVRDISALTSVPSSTRRAVLPRGSAAPPRLPARNQGRSGYLRLISVPWAVPYTYPAKRLEEGRAWCCSRGRANRQSPSSPTG